MSENVLTYYMNGPLDACRIEQCGTNAICTSRDHQISCKCPAGYTGDARVACYPSEFVFQKLTNYFEQFLNKQ